MTLATTPPQATGLAPGAFWFDAPHTKPQGASPRDDTGGDAPFRPEAAKKSEGRMLSFS
jgi:hypothetical protein